MVYPLMEILGSLKKNEEELKVPYVKMFKIYS